MDNKSTIYYYEFVGPAYLDLIDPGNLYGYGVVEIQLPDLSWETYYEDKEIIRIGPSPETVFVNGTGNFRVSYHVSSCEVASTAVWGTHVGDGTIGPAGPAGADGVDGATGATGAQGDPGPEGPVGADGVQGDPGPVGTVGVAPKAAMRTAVLNTQTITESTWDVLTVFDAATVSRGGVTADTINHTLIAGDAGHYVLTMGLNFSFQNNEEIHVIPYVNGVAHSNYPMIAIGRGTDKPIEIFWVSEIDLPVGAVIDLRAKGVAGGGSFDINVVRSTFVLTWDGVPVV